jgi:hypothetical protein
LREHRLRVFENRVLKRLFGPKSRKTYSEENCIMMKLYYSLNIVRMIKSRRIRWAGRVARMGDGRGVHSVWLWSPEIKRPLGRPRRRWADYIKLDLRETGFG